MTLHSEFKDFKCPKCSMPFVPFHKNFKCPNCAEPINEFFDFIPEIIEAMGYHKKRYGRYMPDAWYVGSLADHIQSIIFRTFDILEIDNPANPEEFIINAMEKIDWGDQQYLKNHIKEIALKIYYDKKEKPL